MHRLPSTAASLYSLGDKGLNKGIRCGTCSLFCCLSCPVSCLPVAQEAQVFSQSFDSSSEAAEPLQGFLCDFPGCWWLSLFFKRVQCLAWGLPRTRLSGILHGTIADT